MLKPNEQERRALLNAWMQGRTADWLTAMAAIATWKPQTLRERLAALTKPEAQG